MSLHKMKHDVGQFPQKSRDAQDYLQSFVNYEKQLHELTALDFSLDRFRHLLDLLGNPQQDLRCLHIAGTKGKGSTCAFAANILRQAGFIVGLYTSPHLNDVRERIRVLVPGLKQKNNNELFPDCIPESDFQKLLVALQPYFEEIQEQKTSRSLTFFEVLTACAFYYFKKRRVDFAILETGLGGRLDTTPRGLDTGPRLRGLRVGKILPSS